MADISSFLETIKNSIRGEAVRDSIIDAVKAMNKYGVSVEKISGYNGSGYLRAEDLVTYEQGVAVFNKGKINGTNVFDSTLSKNSKRAVRSSMVYTDWETINKDLVKLLGSED